MSRKIQNKPTLNQTVTQKNLVGELEREQDRLRAQLAAQRSKVGVYLPTEQYVVFEREFQSYPSNTTIEKQVRGGEGKTRNVGSACTGL